MTQPTEEGLRRYPLTGGYNQSIDDDPGEPCTCQPTCPGRCAGECGCAACALQFDMFCEVAGLLGPEPMSDAVHAQAIKAYRAVQKG